MKSIEESTVERGYNNNNSSVGSAIRKIERQLVKKNPNRWASMCILFNEEYRTSSKINTNSPKKASKRHN